MFTSYGGGLAVRERCVDPRLTRGILVSTRVILGVDAWVHVVDGRAKVVVLFADGAVDDAFLLVRRVLDSKGMLRVFRAGEGHGYFSKSRLKSIVLEGSSIPSQNHRPVSSRIEPSS
jgi:hypothetical protein